MRRINHEGRRGGYTLVSILVTMGVLGVMIGFSIQAYLTVKAQAEITLLSSQAGNLGTALQLHYQQKRRFPEAYPAHLETDLAAYVDSQELFISRSNPEAGAEPVNLSYVAPLGGDGNRYVLSLEPKFEMGRAVVLYADGVTEAVEKLSILCNDQPTPSGSLVKGGTIAFETGSQVELTGDTVVAVAQSFRANDGTPIHVLKQSEPASGALTLTAVDTDIIEVASTAAVVFTRTGISEIEFLGEDQENCVKVLARSGEVVVDGRVVTDAGGGSSQPSESQNLAGYVNINPSNCPDFEFTLEKGNGNFITRDDLLTLGTGFRYTGAAVMIRFRPKGNANQNSLFYNGEAYPVRNGRLYTITATDMYVTLFNDKYTGGDGAAMGRWWLAGFFATDAQIVDSGQGKGKGKGKDKKGDDDDGDDDPGDPPADDPPAEGDADDEQYQVSSKGRSVRSLGRGCMVLTGQEVKFGKYN